jgi:hypothetical protein
MRDALLRGRLSLAQSWTDKPLATTCLGFGLTGVLVTVILCLTNTVAGPQAIAMALSTGMTTVGGLLGTLIPDVWTAWRRGFREGCATALSSQPGGLVSELHARPSRQHGQTARLAEGHGLPANQSRGQRSQRLPNSARH